MKWIDISMALSEKLAVWPGDENFKREFRSKIDEGGESNASFIRMSAHSGTHIDAPFHFIEGGTTIDVIDLDVLIGKAYIVQINTGKHITAEDLESKKIPENTERLLLKTSNSFLIDRSSGKFEKGYMALDKSAALWIVQKKIKLIGIDYLSVAPYEDPVIVHKILLEKNIVILEGLDLKETYEGLYELAALPINLFKSDGAPARAAVKRL